jgi:2,3-bisphosphoglycerate-dependent phosphoglycerate mutase
VFTAYNTFFTFPSPGWEDVSLAAEGVKEAQAAGRLLKEHGFTFDVVYTRYENQYRDRTCGEQYYQTAVTVQHTNHCHSLQSLSFLTLSISTPINVYSWLSRAIETAWLVLDELDSLWLPIIKTWRLNERWAGLLCL